MVENRKLFYAISLMLLTCCQIITMLPHNTASSESGGTKATTTTPTTPTATTTSSNASLTNLSNSNNSNENKNKNAKLLQETKNNRSSNNDNDSDFLIIAAERKQQKQQKTIVSGEGVWEADENDSRPADNIDDLIFLDKRPINRHHQQQQQHPEEQLLHHQHSPGHQQQQDPLRTEQKHYEFHHVTMEGDGDGDGNGDSSRNSNSNANSNSEEDDDTDSLTDTTYSSMIVVDDDGDDDDDVDVDVADDGIPHEIELQPDINEEVTPLNVTPLDLSDFLSLIPATKVKTIVNHYYHNDPEVQRAHAFMSSRDFLMLKQHIIAVPEMSAFLHYLNNSGLDLVKFVTALTNLTSYENANTTALTATSLPTTPEPTIEDTTATVAEAKTLENAHKQNAKPANIEIQITTTAPAETTIDDVEISEAAAAAAATTTTTPTTATATEKEQLNGLHGLVDSVLDVLPQDQILATFFDKLEANEQFSKLVDNIGSPEFAKILNNMQNSMPLRNLIFTLHNNGIYVIRIVDSLKSYFFLGGF